MTVDYQEDLLFLRELNSLCDIVNCDLKEILYTLKNNKNILKINHLSHIINPYSRKDKININSEVICQIKKEQ